MAKKKKTKRLSGSAVDAGYLLQALVDIHIERGYITKRAIDRKIAELKNKSRGERQR